MTSENFHENQKVPGPKFAMRPATPFGAAPTRTSAWRHDTRLAPGRQAASSLAGADHPHDRWRFLKMGGSQSHSFQYLVDQPT